MKCELCGHDMHEDWDEIYCWSCQDFYDMPSTKRTEEKLDMTEHEAKLIAELLEALEVARDYIYEVITFHEDAGGDHPSRVKFCEIMIEDMKMVEDAIAKAKGEPA